MYRSIKRRNKSINKKRKKRITRRKKTYSKTQKRVKGGAIYNKPNNSLFRKAYRQQIDNKWENDNRLNTQNKISKEYLSIGENLKKILPKDIVYKLEDSNKLDKFLNQANINNDGMLDEAEFNNFYNKVNKCYKRSITQITNKKYFKARENYNWTKDNNSVG